MAKEMDGKFGLRLKSLREERNLTQAKVSEETGISKRTIEDYEEGKAKNPNAYTVLILASYYSVDPTFLLFGGNTMNNAHLKAILAELSQLAKAEQFKEIHDSDYISETNVAITTKDLTEITKVWNSKGIFESRLYRPYVREIIEKYIQHREEYMKKFNIANGLTVLKFENSLF